MFHFLGPVSDPERVVVACDIVARLTREDSPWGRDVIEALALARPVLSTGSWGGFIRPDECGWLMHPFEAEKCADILIEASAQRERVAAMGNYGRNHILSICGGRKAAADLMGVWYEAAALAVRRNVLGTNTTEIRGDAA